MTPSLPIHDPGYVVLGNAVLLPERYLRFAVGGALTNVTNHLVGDACLLSHPMPFTVRSPTLPGHVVGILRATA